MRLYHGTSQSFLEMDLEKSRPNKDFGRGFYLSASREQAVELAEARVRLLGGSVVV